MSLPPQGGWQQGPVPPNQGQPYGQPFDPSAYNPQQQPPPPGWQQGVWAQQPGPPTPKNNGLKWLLVAVAVLLVVAVSIGATLLFTRDSGGGGGTTPTSGPPSDIASANDTGPVSIITEEPTCDAYTTINNTLAGVQENGWGSQRGQLGPASEWTAEQRLQAQQVAAGMRSAADQVVPLTKITPHRVVREIYELFIAYGRAYADSLPTYKPVDNNLADAAINLGNSLIGVCNAINNKAASRALGLGEPDPPTKTAPIGNASEPARLFDSPNRVCDAWVERESEFATANTDWASLDSAIPGSQWTPEQRAIQLNMLPKLTTLADGMEQSGRQSDNPVLEDVAVLSAVYLRAYVATGDKYTSADSWLSYTGLRINNGVAGACQAAAG